MDEHKPENVQIEIALNWEEFPEETEIIYQTFKNGNIGSLLYVVIKDINTGVYDMNESHRQQLLDGLVDTVSTIYDAMSGIDGNVVDLIQTVNDMATVYQKLQEQLQSTPTQVDIKESSDLSPKPFIKPVEVELLDLGGDDDNNSDLDITGVEDLFIL